MRASPSHSESRWKEEKKGEGGACIARGLSKGEVSGVQKFKKGRSDLGGPGKTPLGAKESFHNIRKNTAESGDGCGGNPRKGFEQNL